MGAGRRSPCWASGAGAVSGETAAVRFTVPRLPVPCPRPRVDRGHAHYTTRYEDWRREVGFMALCSRHGAMFKGDVKLTVTVFGASRRGDWDNIGKGVSDALQGVLYADDAQVRHGDVILLDGAKSERRTEVVVEALA